MREQWQQITKSRMAGIFTTRKQSLRRLCFHRCLSVHRGVSASVHAGIHTSPGPEEDTTPGTEADTPPQDQRQTPPWPYTPPLARHPSPEQTPFPSRYPPADTLLVDTPRRSACWEIRSTSGQYASHWNAFLF